MSVTQRISVSEYQPIPVGAVLRNEIRVAMADLGTRLSPRFPFVSDSSRGVSVGNLIGALRLPSGNILEIIPKTRPGLDWSRAVVDLIEPTTRFEVSGSKFAAPTSSSNSLRDAVAFEYAHRLENAVGSEGPIQVLVRQQHSERRLSGRLDVSRWVRGYSLHPEIFPIHRDEFTTNNIFTRTLAYVSTLLGRSTPNVQLRDRLERLSARVLPGLPTPWDVDPTALHRDLPLQWARYSPAWDLAAALLKNQHLLSSGGRALGLEVAVEPWPLLETLLTRNLHDAAAKLNAVIGFHDFTVPVKSRYPLMRTDKLAMSNRTVQSVEPDGLLLRQGVAFASFEAKYVRFRGKPEREHVFQAISTAAALGAPVAVLVYPEEFGIHRYVLPSLVSPSRIFAIGLDLFGYRPSDSQNGVGRQVLDQVLGSICLDT